MRGMIRRVREAESREAAEQALRRAIQLLDRAAGKRLVHPNTASRTKSRLQKLVNTRS